MKYNEIIQKLNGLNPRSAWKKGVLSYAYGLAENVLVGVKQEYFNPFEIEINDHIVAKYCFNGVRNATEYSYGGCTLIYDEDIAYNLCTLSELKRVNYGHRPPNHNELWLDVQARALFQAAELLVNITKGVI